MPPADLSSPDSKEFIRSRLHELAEDRHIDILYACESGSRAWGFPSPDSDYDVRFVYAKPSAWYLGLFEENDIINPVVTLTAIGDLDLGGWDLSKTFRLIAKSNPVIWEWLQSPTVYLQHPACFLPEFRPIFDPLYSPITACHHYLSICRNTLEKELVGEKVKIKKYFYMLRPLLAAIWIERNKNVPPMELMPLLTLLSDRPEIIKEIENLLQLKQETDEQIPVARNPVIDQFIIQELDRLTIAAKSLPSAKGDKAQLNDLFRQCLAL